MRTHILIVAALALSATTAHAAPRSLSAPQANPIQTAPENVQPAPVYKVQSSEQAPIEQAVPPPATAPAAAPAPTAAPAQAAPAREARPVRQAHRRSKRHRTLTVEQSINRDLRSVQRSIGGISIAGAAGVAGMINAIPVSIPIAIPASW